MSLFTPTPKQREQLIAAGWRWEPIWQRWIHPETRAHHTDAEVLEWLCQREEEE